MQLTSFEDCIKSYLDELAKEDRLFAKTYAKPNKSIQECCKYIYQEVRKARPAGANCVGVDDDEVYGLAIHYYDEDDIKVDATKAKVEVKHVATPKPKEGSAEPTSETPSEPTPQPKPKATKAPKPKDELPDELVIPLF